MPESSEQAEVRSGWNPVATTVACDWCGECDWCQSLHSEDCDHQWLDRPESDTHICEVCGKEGAGTPPGFWLDDPDDATQKSSTPPGSTPEGRS